LILSTALLGLVGSSGCATILRGTKQTVSVATRPDDAQIYADGNARESGTIALSRGDRHVVSAERPGYRPASTEVHRRLCLGWTTVDVLVAIFTFPFGLAAPIVDVATGAIWDLEPERVDLVLPRRAVAEEDTPPPTRDAPY
jgi:hypothetical protein